MKRQCELKGVRLKERLKNGIVQMPDSGEYLSDVERRTKGGEEGKSE